VGNLFYWLKFKKQIKKFNSGSNETWWERVIKEWLLCVGSG
jgi:hypothetical protein